MHLIYNNHYDCIKSQFTVIWENIKGNKKNYQDKKMHSVNPNDLSDYMYIIICTQMGLRESKNASKKTNHKYHNHPCIIII